LLTVPPPLAGLRAPLLLLPSGLPAAAPNDSARAAAACMSMSARA
jgi:hypothetical protein